MKVGDYTFYASNRSDRPLLGTIEKIEGDMVTIRNGVDKRTVDVVPSSRVGEHMNVPYSF